MAKASSSKGSKLDINTSITGSPNWVPVKGLISLEVSGGSTTINEITDMDSTEKEFMAGLRDPGEWSGSLNYDPSDAGQTALLAASVAGTTKQYRFNIPGQESYVSNAIVSSGMGVSTERDGINGRSFALKLTGSTTIANAVS